ncbi:hypothetical protein JOF56_005481 [Kibdelosporangium banguiense]|uniref:DUF6194 domain-containing protein n=1 Tax=Kibdelosporangium banguiense TaxID=1365924 RepID=A0ABS4TL03_9PSEU|nr:DUF6194 family protein [Kibdelosporangium banguiense]MBP2325096.1 hypothetical protein [Kibdelosporangium banguiense]
MDLEELKGQITFDGVRALEHEGDTYYLYDPHSDLPPERQMPFVTIVTGDRHDDFSRLDEPGTYRLNIGLTKATFTARFQQEGEIDYAARDVVMRHPVYGGQYWVCVVNPTDISVIRPLMAEAYQFGVRKYNNHQARTSGHSGQ